MKRCLLLLAFWSGAFAVPVRDRKIEAKALSELTLATGISPGEDVLQETQKRWLRKPLQERWELSEIEEERRSFVLRWAQEQGFFDAWLPSLDLYDKAVILGATTLRMQKRLDFLKELWQKGTRFTEIVWLTGDRPLDARVDSFMDRCNMESEAAQILWEEADLPQEMKNLPVLFIAAPMKPVGERLERPNRGDTVAAWMKVSPNPCKVLFVSNQPFCIYEFSAVREVLPNAFSFDLVGEGVDSYSHPAAAAVILDTVARWVYQESLRNELKSVTSYGA